MINITPQYIKNAGGVLQAISLKSAEVIRELLDVKNIKQLNKSKLDILERILVHSSPHLDEYLAVLLFRACLPLEKLHKLQFEEFSLHSMNNDQLAKAIWPTSAVFGIGGTHDGGAKPLIMYDEHVPEGMKRPESSCSIMTKKRHLSNIDIPLYKVISEVDHIDAYANAHNKHLGNYIKLMHDTEYIFSKGSTVREDIKDPISPIWKQSLVEACITAFILGIHDKKPFSNPDYWRKPAQDSLDHYAKHSLLKDDPKFSIAFGTLKTNISNVYNFNRIYLTITESDNTKRQIVNKQGLPIKQLMLMPYLAALCQDYWGPYLGHIIMAHFWEARIQAQISYENIKDILKTTIGNGIHEIPYVRTPVGQLSFRHIPVMQNYNGKMRTPWVIEIILNGVMPNAKAPMLSFLNSNNNGIGYIILHNTGANNLVLNKGSNIDYTEWQLLWDKLILLEGNSDVVGNDVAGCWHRTLSNNKIMAGFFLNGNKAHQYVPHTSLDAESLLELVSQLKS